jgi:hypothetical protein
MRRLAMVSFCVHSVMLVFSVQLAEGAGGRTLPPLPLSLAKPALLSVVNLPSWGLKSEHEFLTSKDPRDRYLRINSL